MTFLGEKKIWKPNSVFENLKALYLCCFCFFNLLATHLPLFLPPLMYLSIDWYLFTHLCLPSLLEHSTSASRGSSLQRRSLTSSSSLTQTPLLVPFSAPGTPTPRPTTPLLLQTLMYHWFGGYNREQPWPFVKLLHVSYSKILNAFVGKKWVLIVFHVLGGMSILCPSWHSARTWWLDWSPGNLAALTLAPLLQQRPRALWANPSTSLHPRPACVGSSSDPCGWAEQGSLPSPSRSLALVPRVHVELDILRNAVSA